MIYAKLYNVCTASKNKAVMVPTSKIWKHAGETPQAAL